MLKHKKNILNKKSKLLIALVAVTVAFSMSVKDISSEVELSTEKEVEVYESIACLNAIHIISKKNEPFEVTNSFKWSEMDLADILITSDYNAPTKKLYILHCQLALKEWGFNTLRQELTNLLCSRNHNIDHNI